MKKTGISSKKQILIISLIFILPFVIYMTAYNIYSMHVLAGKIARANQSKIYVYQTNLEKDLHSVDDFMSNIVANDLEYGRLQYTLDPLDAHLYTYDILQKYREILASDSIIGGLYIFTQKNQLYRYVYSDAIPFSEQEKLNGYLRTLTDTGRDLWQRGWFSGKVGDRNYLFRVTGGNGTYSICMVDFSLILSPNDAQSPGGDGFLMYASPQTGPLTELARIADDRIVLHRTAAAYYITGWPQKYLVVQRNSRYAGLTLVYAMRYNGVLSNLDAVQITMMTASLVLFLLLLLCYSLLRHTFFRPLSKLIGTMETIKGGDMEARLAIDSRIAEFATVGDTFNGMLEQIRSLKILAYERQLEVNRSRLQFLQIQIRPHFFLNCLKNIYALAQEQKYRQVQEMILVLSDYLRSMFRGNPDTVPLSDELHNVDTYILLQQMSMACHPVCAVDTDRQLLDFPVPPLSVLTFVENAVKHGAQPNKPLRIHVGIRLLKNERDEYLNISVQDNGVGFSDETLRRLNSGGDEAPTEKHVGIANVRRRFALIYRNASISFHNQFGGACVEIFIPYRRP